MNLALYDWLWETADAECVMDRSGIMICCNGIRMLRWERFFNLALYDLETTDVSTVDLRKAFAEGAGPDITCTGAFLNYERSELAPGIESQVLRFEGRKANGDQFVIRSGSLPANTILIDVAKKMGAELAADKPITLNQ